MIKNREHDMGTLFTLILTYNIYFTCIICEILKFQKYPVNITTTNVHKDYIIGSTIGLESKLNSMNKRSCYWDIYSHPYCQLIQRLEAKMSPQYHVLGKKRINTAKTLPLQKGKQVRPPFSRINAKIYRRKLLSYERNLREQPMRCLISDGMHRNIEIKESEVREKKHNIVTKNAKANDEDVADNRIFHNREKSVTWDDWSKWSTCSVTCGQGRQVRWRHCSSKNCTKGLKKAQMKSCHLKNCDTKSILGWLGIKS